MAHACWLRLVNPELDLAQLPAANFETQKREVTLGERREGEAVLISVFLTPETPVESGLVTEDDRLQVLDAIIDYGGERVVVVENKVAEADDLQARHINLSGGNARLDDGTSVRVVVWRDLLEAFAGLLERGLVAGAERELLSDFLTYTEDHFGDLGPFRTLALCAGNRFRQKRRLRSLLHEATGLEARIDRWGPSVRIEHARQAVGAHAYLQLTDDELVELSIYPADTLSQAREFYTDRALVERIQALNEQDGWEVRPNFHFGHMQAGYAWTTGACPLGRYLEIWSDQIEQTGRVPRAEWEDYWAWLVQEGIARRADRSDFDRHFTATQRQSADPRPGLEVTRRWSREAAEALDARSQLAAAVHAGLARMMECFGEDVATVLPIRGNSRHG